METSAQFQTQNMATTTTTNAISNKQPMQPTVIGSLASGARKLPVATATLVSSTLASTVGATNSTNSVSTLLSSSKTNIVTGVVSANSSNATSNATVVGATSTPVSTTTIHTTATGDLHSQTSSIIQPSASSQKSNTTRTKSANDVLVANTINSVSCATNLITPTNATVVSNGQATPTQQIIQVSSQGSAIMPGQQLMVQTLSGRSAIQLRTGQQFQQIQLIPFGNLQAQNQRPVIIQQTPGNMQLHSCATTITSMANPSTHNNVTKLSLVGANATNPHQKPVIIQQSATGQFIHSTNAQPHSLHGHNVTKIATVGRAPVRPSAQAGKMVLTSTGSLATNATTALTTNHTGVLASNSANHHLANSATNLSTNANNPQQVTRLNIISSLPSGVHTNVVQQHTTSGKQPILSLAPTVTLNKPLIINPATSVVQPSIVGNVVNMSNFNATSHHLKQSNTTNIIPTVMTLTTLTTSSGSSPGRHTMITSTNSQTLAAQQQAHNSQFNAISSAISSSVVSGPSVSGGGGSGAGKLIINNSSNQSTNSIVNQPQTITSTSSSLNVSQQQNMNQSQANVMPQSTQLTSSSTIRQLGSPIKQQIPQTTPSSPRPSILIRKRVGTPLDQDSKSIYQSSPASAVAASINSSNLNAKASHLNSVKHNLSLKYCPTSLSSSGNTLSTNAVSFSESGSGLMKNAREITTDSSLRNANKLQAASNLVNSASKKVNSSSITENSGQQVPSAVLQSQSEQSLQNDSKQSSLGNMKQSVDIPNQLANHTSSGSLSSNAATNSSMNFGAGFADLSNNSASVDNRQITPRKRRKQLLEPFTLTTSQNIKLLNDDSNSVGANLLCNEDLMKKKDSNGIYHVNSSGHSSAGYKSSIVRRPRPSLLSSYNLSWKSLQHHFLRHTEVKIKNEKKVNLQDLTSETLKKRNGWKVNHLSAQLEDILESEILFNRKLKELSSLYCANKSHLPPKVQELGSKPFNTKVCHNSISILDKLNDLFAANTQRSNLFHDQIRDTNNLLNKLSNDHKDKVNKMTKKLLNTRRSASLKV